MILLSSRQKEKGNIGSIQSWYIERREFLHLIKEQRDYHERFKVYFRMSAAQFDALLAILEPHIKKKTTNFCELGVQGSLKRFVLRDEVDELDNRHSGFYSPDPIFFMMGKSFGGSVSKRDWQTMRLNLFFNLRAFRTQCAVALRVKSVDTFSTF